MALYRFVRLNASAAVYKDTNRPEHPGYRLTASQWDDVTTLDGNYNAQVAIASLYDERNRGAADATEVEGEVEVQVPLPTIAVRVYGPNEPDAR